MVTECEPKPISMNFGSPRRGEGGEGSCVEGMAMLQDWIGQKKKTILDWPEDFHHPTYAYIFAATEICAELCYQSTWGHLPQLSTKFEPWMKHLSVFDMKQQYILKLILLRGITLFSTGIIS